MRGVEAMFREKNRLQMRFPFLASSIQLAFDVGNEAFDGQAIAMDLCRAIHHSKGISHFLHLIGPKPLSTISNTEDKGILKSLHVFSWIWPQ